MRAFPSSVFGPVLGPPCMRQRPFGIAGPRQQPPERVLAPQRGALAGFPVLLPYMSRPIPGRRSVRGLLAISGPPPGLAPPALDAAGRNDRLPAGTNLNMLVHDTDGLLAASPDTIKR